MTQELNPCEVTQEEVARECPFCGEKLIAYAGSSTLFHPGVVTDTDCFYSGRSVPPYQIPLWNTRHRQSAQTSQPTPVADEGRREAVELAYGLLWGMSIDRRIISDDLAARARETLLSQIDKDGQRRGIEAARATVDGGGGE